MGLRNIAGMVAIALPAIAMIGCASFERSEAAKNYPESLMTTYDKFTTYSIDERNDGLTVDIRYVRDDLFESMAYRAEGNSLRSICESHAIAVSVEMAIQNGRLIKPVRSKDVQVHARYRALERKYVCRAQVFTFYEGEEGK